MSTFTYFLVTQRTDARVALVQKLNSLVKDYGELTEAKPFRGKHPVGLEVPVSPTGGDWLTDFLPNIHGVLLVSEKARRVLESEGICEPGVEYLPLGIRNRRDERVDEPYFILNLLRTVECFDWKNSAYKTYPDEPDRLMFPGMRKMVLRDEMIPPDAKLFRLAEQTKRIIFRSDLVDRLKAEGCTGLFLTPMGGPLL